jgi:flagellar assembly protein FliH
MSSKVLEPDNQRAATALHWRQVQAEPDKPADEMSEDFRRQVSRMEQQCEQRVREARLAGIREGEVAGQGRAAASLQPVLEQLSRSIDELANLRPRLRQDAERDMVKLSLAIARRVLRRELAIDPDALHGLVLAALEKLQGQETCRVRVHPQYAGPISAYLRDSPAGQRVEVVADAASEPGAAVFETERGQLDASVETQLQEIERGLADQLRRHT